jgi:hypothetical protein
MRSIPNRAFNAAFAPQILRPTANQLYILGGLISLYIENDVTYSEQTMNYQGIGFLDASVFQRNDEVEC